MDKKILIVDDEAALCRSLQVVLEREEYRVLTSDDAMEAQKIFKKEEVDLVVTDLKMPGMSGIELLKAFKKINPDIPVILMTAYATVETAVEAIKEGAEDYIKKPFEAYELSNLIARVFQKKEIAEENVLLRTQLKEALPKYTMIGESPAIEGIREIISQVAPSDSTVLITGESGTGKELVAFEIHRQSPRALQNFVKVNCPAIPSELMESEFFGHEKGSFTGAVDKRIGKFELANRGTIFLDEIGELDPGLQVKLLRVLQDREIDRIGGRRTIKVDVRVVAATNRNLLKAIERGTFREDLFYRLNVVPIHIPPLRDRKEDIPLLVEHFLEKFRRAMGKEVQEVDHRVMERIMAYEWPGNIRELQNLIERAVLLAKREMILPDNLKFLFDFPAASPEKEVQQPLSLETVEKRAILEALKLSGGKKDRAAHILGINRATLFRKIKKYNLDP